METDKPLTHISDLFGGIRVPQKKGRRSERGDLIDYFLEKLSPGWHGARKLTFGYLAFRLTGFNREDLYFLKSNCDQEERRGQPWGKIFWGSIKSSG
jgi:hypothetical protein